MQSQQKHLSPYIAWSLVALFAGALAFVTWYYYDQVSTAYDNSVTFFGVNVHKKTTTTTTPSTTTSTSTTSTTTPSVAPEKVAENFYNFYLNLINPNGQMNGQAIFQSTSPYKLKSSFSTYLTSTLITHLESLYNSSSTNHDLILCAQDIPDRITYDKATITNTTATSIVNLQFSPVSKITLGYLKQNNSWLINSITCP